MSKPTPEQMEHFYDLQKKGIITRANIQGFLQNPNRFVSSFSTIIDNTVGLIPMIQTAVGPKNLRNINLYITPDRFKLGEGVRKVDLELAPFLDGEIGEQAAKRLVAEGYILEGIGELAQFLADNPEEVEKYSWVVALNEASRWAGPSGLVSVPCAFVSGAYRSFNLSWFARRFDSDFRVLVSRPSK